MHSLSTGSKNMNYEKEFSVYDNMETDSDIESSRNSDVDTLCSRILSKLFKCYNNCVYCIALIFFEEASWFKCQRME